MNFGGFELNSKSQTLKNTLFCSILISGRCSNGTESVGCGPQEEFRACADVAITTAEGYADETVNTLTDPEVYVPREDEDRYNEIDFNAINNEDQILKNEVAVESVVIIVLASILGMIFIK